MNWGMSIRSRSASYLRERPGFRRWNSGSRLIEHSQTKRRYDYNNQRLGYATNDRCMDLYVVRTICGDKNIMNSVATGKTKLTDFAK